MSATGPEGYAGRRALVTGCSSGVGLAAATALIRLGAEVTGLSRRRPEIDLAAFHQVDLADESSVLAAANRLPEGFDVVFNCAGAPPTVPSLELVQVNFLGPRLLTERVSASMPSGGAIVNVSSSIGSGWRSRVALLREFAATRSYATGVRWYIDHEVDAGHSYLFSKEAVSAWTMLQSSVLIDRGIRVNATSPGPVATPLKAIAEAAFPPELIAGNERPIGRASTVEEQVAPLLFLNSAAASYINGAELAVDGGHQALLATSDEG